MISSSEVNFHEAIEMTTLKSSPTCHNLIIPPTTTSSTTTTTTTHPPLSSPEKPPPSLHLQNQKSKLPKRIKFTDESGWTHIIRGSKAQRKQSFIIQPTSMAPQLKPQEVADKYNSVETACMRLKEFTGDWEESECRKKMEEMMEKDVLMSDKVKIGNCVCLGLGSLTGVNGSKSSWYELVTLIWILKILGKFSAIYYHTNIHTNHSPHSSSFPPPFYHVSKKSFFFGPSTPELFFE